MNEQTQDDQSFGLDPGEFKATGAMVGATVLSRNIMGPNGYRGVPILRDLLGGERAGVALSRTMRNARLAGMGLGAMFGGPVGALVGLVGANYLGKEGLLQTFMNQDLAHKIAYGTKPPFKNKFGTIDDLSWETTAEKIGSVPKLRHHPSSEMVGEQEKLVATAAGRNNTQYKKLGDFLKEERQRTLGIFKNKFNPTAIADEVTGSAKVISNLYGKSVDDARAELSSSFAARTAFASSKGLVAAKIFGGTISESFSAIAEMSASSAGVFAGRAPNLRVLLGRTRKANFIESYETAVRARLHAFVDGTTGSHYLGSASSKLNDVTIGDAVTGVVPPEKPNHRKDRKSKRRRTRDMMRQEIETTYKGSLLQNSEYDVATRMGARFTEAREIFEEFDHANGADYVKKLESEWRSAAAIASSSKNVEEVEAARKRMKSAETKFNSTVRAMDSRNPVSDVNKTVRDAREQINRGISRRASAEFSSIRTKAAFRYGATLLKHATFVQLGTDVLLLGLRGVWSGANKMNNALAKMRKQEFGSGRSFTSDLATSERQRALQAIQTNRMQATSFLGMEARARAMNGYQ